MTSLLSTTNRNSFPPAPTRKQHSEYTNMSGRGLDMAETPYCLCCHSSRVMSTHTHTHSQGQIQATAALLALMFTSVCLREPKLNVQTYRNIKCVWFYKNIKKEETIGMTKQNPFWFHSDILLKFVCDSWIDWNAVWCAFDSALFLFLLRNPWAHDITRLLVQVL